MGSIIKQVAVSESKIRLFDNGYIKHAYKASKKCIKKANVNLDSVQLLINTGIYREESIVEPSVASLIHSKLQSKFDCTTTRKKSDFFSFDLSNGGVGTLQAIQVADIYIRSGKITEGSYEKAITDSLTWLQFKHRRSGERESFSQAIFKLLGYPENKLSSYANITIHELLRLVYSDQLTAVNKIFRQQDFDPDEMRQTVGEFLLGIDDLDLHGLRLKLREKEKKIAGLSGRLKATQEILTTAGIEPDPFAIQAEVDQLISKRTNLRERIDFLESPVEKEKSSEEAKEVELIQKELAQVKLNIRKQLSDRDSILFELEDSKAFIESIVGRRDALNQSDSTKEALGEILFKFCPACLSTINLKDGSDNHVCHLCKKDHSDKEENPGFLRMQFELNYQINESEQLLISKQRQSGDLNQTIEQLHIKRKGLQERYNSFVFTADPIAAELKDSLTKIGQYDKTLDNLREKQQLIAIIDDISNQKANISKEISILNDTINRKQQSREMRLRSLQTKISRTTIEILRNDIPSEETFENAEEFEFDFGKNRLMVDGQSKFSASSVCYLKTAFLFAVFFTSLDDEKMLFPRFIVLDNIEDKGAVPERVQNIHNLIVNYLEEIESEHQVIFTTSLLSENLNNEKYCVGPEYNFNLKTLNL